MMQAWNRTMNQSARKREGIGSVQSKTKACLNKQDEGEGGRRDCCECFLRAHSGKGGGTG